MSVFSYHHDICAEGFSESHAHTLILEPSSGSASSGSPLLRDAQFHRFCHFLHYSFLCSCPPLDGLSRIRFTAQVKAKITSRFADRFMRSLPCDQSPHFSLSPAPFLPPLFNSAASLTFYCLSLTLSPSPSITYSHWDKLTPLPQSYAKPAITRPPPLPHLLPPGAAYYLRTLQGKILTG